LTFVPRPSSISSCSSVISAQTLRSAASASRDWSTYAISTVAPTLSVPASGLLPGDEAEQRGLPRPVGADDADDAAAGQAERQVLEEDDVAIRLGQAVCDDDLVTQPLRRRDHDLRLRQLLALSWLSRSSYALRRALPLAWRARGAMRIHSSSRSSVRWRDDCCFSSCCSRVSFCSSHDE
jgi:hypothetical protein